MSNVIKTPTIKRFTNYHNNFFTFKKLPTSKRKDIETRLFFYSVNLVDIPARKEVLRISKDIEREFEILKIYEQANNESLNKGNKNTEHNDKKIEEHNKKIEILENEITATISKAQKNYNIPIDLLYTVTGLENYETDRDRVPRLKSACENLLKNLIIDIPTNNKRKPFSLIPMFTDFTLDLDNGLTVGVHKKILPLIYNTYRKFTNSDISLLSNLPFIEQRIYLLSCQFRTSKHKFGVIPLEDCYNIFNVPESSQNYPKFNQRILHQFVLPDKSKPKKTNKRMPLTTIFNDRQEIPFTISIEPVKEHKNTIAIKIIVTDKEKEIPKIIDIPSFPFDDIVSTDDLTFHLINTIGMNKSTVNKIINFGLNYANLRPCIERLYKANKDKEIKDTSKDRLPKYLKGIIQNQFPELRKILETKKDKK